MENSLKFAQSLDQEDILAHFRHRFHLPLQENGHQWIYFTGNSLGLQPKTANDAISHEMQRWADLGVEGHFLGQYPWFDYHKHLKPGLAHIVGAKENEVTPMGSLTANLHFLLATFYQPQGKRRKILLENQAFPSDQYALETQARFHGYHPDDILIELEPRKGEHHLHTEDILQKIAEIGDELALVMLGGVNYYSGQVFDIHRITNKAHQVGAYAGFDLAHAVGNVTLKLHEWQSDFAAWCSYKYLNSSPGGVGGIFVHQRNHHLADKQLLAGWWGYDEATRFQMQKGFKPMSSVDAWQLSNVPIMLLAIHRASLDIFLEAGMENLREKSEKMTEFLGFILEEINLKYGSPIEVITPKNPKERGCQFSLLIEKDGKKIFQSLQNQGIMIDWREPNVIRLAPVPLYNTFTEIYLFGQALSKSLES